MKIVSLVEIAKLLNLPPAADVRITGIASLTEATETDISFLGSDRYLPDFEKTRAAAVIVQKRVRLPQKHAPVALVVDDADLAVAKVLSLFAPREQMPPAGVDPSARIAPDAQLPVDARIGPNAVVGARSRLGKNCVLHAGVVIGDDVTIGDNCRLYPNVVVRERIAIGNRVVIHAGSVLGTDGFGYRWDGQKHEKIPHIGTVIVEDDVEIGSCVCIDRAKFSATRIGQGTKIDNLVQIGHNVQVGRHCILVGQTGIAGSAVLGDGVVLGGQTAVRDHVSIGAGAMAAARSAIAEDVEEKTIVSGMPALPHRQSLREQAALRRLPDLIVQMRKLQEEVARLRGENPKPETRNPNQ